MSKPPKNQHQHPGQTSHRNRHLNPVKKYCDTCRFGYKTTRKMKQAAARQEETRNRKKREIDRQMMQYAPAVLPKAKEPLEESTVEVEGRMFTLYKCAKLEMRATTLPCGLREDCYRLKCPHIPGAA